MRTITFRIQDVRQFNGMIIDYDLRLSDIAKNAVLALKPGEIVKVGQLQFAHDYPYPKTGPEAIVATF